MNARPLRKPENGSGFGDGFKAPTDATIARAVDIATRWKAVKEWGAEQKLPWTKATQTDLDKFISEGLQGRVDTTVIQGVTADIKRLELEAAEWDKKNNVPNPFRAKDAKTSFDIESATPGTTAASAVSTATDDASKFVKDAAKEARDSILPVLPATPSVPAWVMVAGGLAAGVVLFAVAANASKQAADAASTVGLVNGGARAIR